MFEIIRQDLARARRMNTQGLVSQLFDFGTLAVVVYRFGHWAKRLRAPVIRQLLLVLYAPLQWGVRLLSGVWIPLGADIGPGLVIHSWPGVYLPPCRIGRNAFFQHGVVVTWKCRSIGDDAYFGAGAKVIRAVHIGNRVRIGANAVVTRDIPDDSTVAVPLTRVFNVRGATGSDAGPPHSESSPDGAESRATITAS